jgi:hypothetical protein
MIPFFRGFVCGFILKKQIIQIFEKVLEKCILIKDSINKNNETKNNRNSTITLAIKIVYKELFKKEFNDLLPPLWDYYPKKNVILIELSNSIFNFITHFFKLKFKLNKNFS